MKSFSAIGVCLAGALPAFSQAASAMECEELTLGALIVVTVVYSRKASWAG
jgi:hypothetical protein